MDVAKPALRAQLAQTLPDYMLPSAIVRLDTLPRTPNGKLDRAALPAPQVIAADDARSYEAPQGVLETTVARLWAELLQLERVSRRDSFFKLGGHSLLAGVVVSRLRSAATSSVAPGNAVT